MHEAHASRYSVYPRANKMYYDLRDMYCWPGMKKDIATYVSKCLTCSKAKIRESRLIGPEMVQETTNKVVQIKERLKAAKDCQKSYVDNRQNPLEFSVGDQVLLKVSHWKGVVCFSKKGKLAPSVHETFHVSNLKVCLADVNLHVPLEKIKVDKNLCFVEKSVDIMDHKVKKLKRSRIPTVNVCWNSKRGPEFTWKCKDFIKAKYLKWFREQITDESTS
nr:putative reverse transcriptase domain-containing protein [Tanacetum cinerariifolium]